MADIKGNDKEFLEYIVKGLVDHPEDVTVERTVDEMGVLLSLRVHPEDMGQVVGRAGATAKAIRSLVRIVGLKNHARVNLKIEEPEGGRVQRRERFPQSSQESQPSQSSQESQPSQPSEESQDSQDVKDSQAGELEDLKL